MRQEQKQLSRARILEAAACRLREEGIDGASVAAVMKDAGLTHGGFYAHFNDKDELVREALVHALAGNRDRWVGSAKNEGWRTRLSRLAKRYLTGAHRDNLSDSCALAAVGSQAGRADDAFKRQYETELLKTLSAICGRPFDQTARRQGDEALVFMSLMIGAMTLSRAVKTEALSNRLMTSAKVAAGEMTIDEG